VVLSPVEYHKKSLHHQQGNIYRGIALLGYLNTFSEEISGVHSDRSLKYLSFLRRQCVVLSPAECHKEISSCQQRKVCLQRDYHCPGLPKHFLWKKYTELNLTDYFNFFVMFAEAICGGWFSRVS